LPAKQGRHGVNIWDVRRDDKRRHRKPGFPLEPHLPNERAYKAMCEIIHNPAAGGMVSEWQYGVIAMLILCTLSGGGVGKRYPQIPRRIDPFDMNGLCCCFFDLRVLCASACKKWTHAEAQRTRRSKINKFEQIALARHFSECLDDAR
jgi:hypothetical protein